MSERRDLSNRPTVFHDVTVGTNVVTVSCATRTRNCTPGSYGYSAGVGYDLATGLGSVDFYNLVTNWKGPSSGTPSTANLTLASTAATISPTDSVTLTATLTASNASIPLGTVTFRLGSAVLGTSALVAGTNQSSATLSVTGASLSVGPNTIVAEYAGNASYASANASTTVTVTQPADPLIGAFTNSASYQTIYAPGMLMSIFGSQLAPVVSSATTLPLPSQLVGVSVTLNGLTAPLLYVSPSLLNIQIPYEIEPGVAVTVVVNNNGRSATGSFTAAATAPGIFIDTNFAPIPNASASRGQTVTLYMTGAGAITPAVATGDAPDPNTALANLPRPQQALTVTVGGIPATTPFIAIPWGSVGVVQVNYQIPDSVPLGSNPVIVQIGNVSSAPATVTINP